MDLTRITWEERDGVGIATLNRPERLNAIDTRTAAELEQVVEVAWNRDSVRCLLLAANGRGFSAGADVKEWASGESQPDPGEDG